MTDPTPKRKKDFEDALGGANVSALGQAALTDRFSSTASNTPHTPIERDTAIRSTSKSGRGCQAAATKNPNRTFHQHESEPSKKQRATTNWESSNTTNRVGERGTSLLIP